MIPGLASETSADFRHLSETGLRKDRIECETSEERKQEKLTESLYEEGVTLYRQGRLRLALETFDQVLSENPQHFAAIFHRGTALLKLKCYEEALETFERASK